MKEREGGLLARERSVVEAEALARVKETELAGREERLAKVRSGSWGAPRVGARRGVAAYVLLPLQHRDNC